MYIKKINVPTPYIIKFEKIHVLVKTEKKVAQTVYHVSTEANKRRKRFSTWQNFHLNL